MAMSPTGTRARLLSGSAVLLARSVKVSRGVAVEEAMPDVGLAVGDRPQRGHGRDLSGGRVAEVDG
jgi:hypothetical protein